MVQHRAARLLFSLLTRAGDSRIVGGQPDPLPTVAANTDALALERVAAAAGDGAHGARRCRLAGRGQERVLRHRWYAAARDKNDAAGEGDEKQARSERGGHGRVAVCVGVGVERAWSGSEEATD